MDPLKALVTSEARALVLSSLFADRGRAFFQRELARATQLPLAAVQRELHRLVAGGLVRREVVDGRGRYSAETRSAVYAELAAIVRKLRGPQSVIRDALAARRRVRIAFVFGSFANGESTASSDIDLLILGDESTRAIRTALARAERDLSRSVNEHVLSTDEWRSRLKAGDPFIEQVRRSNKLWVIGDEDALPALDAPKARR
jgi:predicted nucleotidyltransferase